MEDEVVVRIVDGVNSVNGYAQEICDCIRIAQTETFKKSGLRINTYGLTPDVLSEQLRAGGVCFIACCKSAVIGTLSVFKDKKNWYSNNGIIIKYVAVLPNWQGKHIATLLLENVKNTNRDKVISVSTDEKNKTAIHLYRKNGFLLVDISRAKNAKSNAVRLAYWEHGCPLNCRRTIRLAWCRIKCFLKSVIWS